MPLSRINTRSLTDGTVAAADIADGSVTTSKLSSTLDLSSKTMTYGNLPAPNLTGALPAIDGSSLTGIAAGASANGTIYENSTTISTSYTLTANTNGFTVGPVTLASGASVTVPSGQRWVVL